MYNKNKKMDEYTEMQNEQENRMGKKKLQQYHDVSFANIRKDRAGTIINTRTLQYQDQGKQQVKLSQKMSMSSVGRVHTLPNPKPMFIISQSQSKKRNLAKHQSSSRQEQFSENTNHKVKHSRCKSYHQHRDDLQKQLQNLMIKKSRLDELKQNKSKLKSKLKQLQWKLKQIKIEDKYDSERTKHTKHETESKKHNQLHKKGTKHIRLKPIVHKPSIEQDEQQATKQKSRVIKKQKPNNEGHTQNEQEIDSYYVGQLHHKCLNCNHFSLKVEDIRIPPSIKQQMKQLAKQM